MAVMQLKPICHVCSRKEGLYLCDFVVTYMDGIFVCSRSKPSESGVHDYRGTCDVLMCESCTTKHNNCDFCSYHAGLLTKLELPNGELLRKAIRQRIGHAQVDYTPVKPAKAKPEAGKARKKALESIGNALGGVEPGLFDNHE